MKQISGEALRKFLAEQPIPYELVGDFSAGIDGYCALDAPKDDCILWIKNPETTNLSLLKDVKNSVVVTPSMLQTAAVNLRCIITPEPKSLFFGLLKHFWSPISQKGIACTAVVESTAVAENVSIGHHCYIGADVAIGSGTVIEHNVTITHSVTIGENCIIHSGASIGADGFGYYLDHDGMPCKVEHYGGVSIGNDVEIGANTCIDRGTLGNTTIGDHSKIDNLVHIAHNVIIGKNVMVIAQSLVAGSAQLRDNSYVAPGAIIKNQLIVGENAFVGMGAVVTKDVEPNTVVAGVPAVPLRKVKKGDK